MSAKAAIATTTLHLTIAGASSRIASSLCAACPHAPAGCCTGPPPFRWADIGRVVAGGGPSGRDWVLGQIAVGRLRASGDGLTIVRRRGLARPDGPRTAKCAYHGPSGCSLASETRPAACNYYVCEEALDVAGSGAARALHADLARRLTAFNAILAQRIVSAWPGGVTFDAAFLDWLGAEFAALESGRDSVSDRS